MLFCIAMAIKGEVLVKSMIWAPAISLNDGRYVIHPFECKIIGQAEGLARVKASIHTFYTTFDDEAWRIITLFVNHLDSKLGRGMGSPIPRLEEGAWTREGPRVVGGGFVRGSVDPFDLEP